MKRFLLVAPALVSAAFAQDASPRTSTVVVRHLTVHTDAGLPRVAFPALFEAWKGQEVGLYTELKTAPELLAQAADRADRTIERAFEQAGRVVVVRHDIEVMPPLNRYVEVRFRVAPAGPIQ